MGGNKVLNTSGLGTGGGSIDGRVFTKAAPVVFNKNFENEDNFSQTSFKTPSVADLPIQSVTLCSIFKLILLDPQRFSYQVLTAPSAIASQTHQTRV